MKRQEVGRGLRLCVNQDGFRMDEQSLGKELVHKVNKLTVVASESYKDFVTDLQRQIKDVLYDRPTKASKEYFVGKMIHVDGVPQKISDQQATAIYRYLLKNDYIDDNEHITEQYRADLENNALAPLAEELKTMTEGIHKLIQSIFNDKILEDMIGNGNETTVPSNDLNENFAKKEFQTLWNYINHKYAYTVDFDSNELIKKAIEHIDRELYESLFVISDSDKKDPGTDTILTLRPVHPWDRMDEDEFVQCIKGIVPNPAVQIEIETDKRSESYSSDYFDDLDLSPLLDYSWNNTKNIRKIDIDLTCEEYGFKGRGCIGILIKNDMPVEEIEILSKDVEIDGEIYTLSSSVKYKNNCITETSTSISVDEDGEIDTNTSWSERFKSKSSLSIHGIEVPYNLFPNYSNKMSKAVLNILFPFSFRLDIGVNSDLNLNSARDQIIYDEKWLTFEENLYQVICKRLKEQLSLSDWERLNEIIQKNGKNIFSRVANNIE